MKINRVVSIFVFLGFVFSSSIQAATTYSQVYVFGDSLSDTGNLASVVGPFPTPPFYQNRVSNGPVAVELLAEKLGRQADASLHLIGPASGTNYAVAGALAAGSNAIDLPAQLTIFLANHGYTAPADALYVIFIGGNDIRSARSILNKPEAQFIIDAAVQSIKQTVDTLIQSGARSFVLLNPPNIGIIPETRILSIVMNDSNMPKRAKRLSQYFRQQLDEVLDDYDHRETIEIVEFDLYKYFNKLVKKADKYGFSNNTDACFSSITFTFNPGCNYGANFDQYVFFDEIHPTARVHSIIADAVYEKLTSEDEHHDEDNDSEND